METSHSRDVGNSTLDADPPHVLNLLDVLRQLAVSAVDCIFDKLGRDGRSSARRACKALRGFVDANLRGVELHFSSEDAMNLRSRPGFTSPVARFRRCSCLSIMFWKGKEAAAHDVIQHPALLASLYMVGVGADVARNITELCLEGPLELPTLVTVALVLAGTLRHVRILVLDNCPYGMGSYSFNNMHALHTTLRGAFPALEELILPARACLRGLEAFAGSRLHTVRVMVDTPGCLHMPHVRSLLQLPQLRELDLDGENWGVLWRGDGDVWDDEGGDVWDYDWEDTPAGAAELPLGDASDEETIPDELDWPEVRALQRLLVSPPPALERLRWPEQPQLEVGFAGGRITCVHLYGSYCYAADLRRAAATLLPVLAATGRRLPLLKVWNLVENSSDITSLLQPHTPFSRLLAATDCVELGRLVLESSGTAAEEAAAAALQAVVTAVGGLPEKLVFGSSGRDSKLELQTRSRYSGGTGGDSQAAGSAATPAAPAAVMLAEVTAQQVLERAAARMWDTAEAEAAATVAGVEAVIAAYEADGDDRRPRTRLDNMYVLLRGPFVWQRTCGPAKAGGRGAARLKKWLESLVVISLPPATAAAAAGATPGSPAGTAAAAGAPGVVKVKGCSFVACGSGSALAVVECADDSIAALQLYRAAAAAAASEAPGCLQVSACKADDFRLMDTVKRYWAPPIREVIRELWDDHRSTPVQAMRTAGAGQEQAGGQERPGQAAVGQGEEAAGRDEAVALECDLQVLQHLLRLAEQAHKAVATCK